MTQHPPILHLYRSLLREATYLPLPQSREYFRKHVISSFHRHRGRQQEASRVAEISNLGTHDVIQEETALHRKARHTLSVLSRANAGQIAPFTTVLKHTFARRGHRRRQLMHHLMHPSSPEPYPSPHATLSEPGTDWKPPPAVQALLKSQHRQQDYLTQTGYKVKAEGPELPDKNIWGNPMPRCRTKNAWQRWYATFTARLFPPLPEAEYKEILAVAKGWVTVKQPERRVRASVPVFAEASTEEGVAVNVLEDPKPKPKGAGGKRVIKERFVQRRMEDLLRHIPLQRPTNVPDRPVVYQWRDAREGAGIPVRAASMGQANALFG